MRYKIEPLISKELLLSISPANPTELMERQFEDGGRVVLLDDVGETIEKLDYQPEPGLNPKAFRRQLGMEAIKMVAAYG